MIVAALRAHDTAVATGKTPKTRIAMTLIETLRGGAAAGDAMNISRKSNADTIPEQRVQGNRFATHRQGVGNRIALGNPHLAQIADDACIGHRDTESRQRRD
jgi:hypothetical protein